MPERSDAELVRAVRRGDKDAYADLYRRYERSVMGIAMHWLNDRHAAEDAAQEIFVMAYSKLGHLRDVGKFGPWLLVVAKRHVARLATRRRTMISLEGLDPVAPDSKDSFLAGDHRTVLQAVDRLPKQERLVVSLRYFDRHSVGKIAEITGRSVGTVTKQLTRAHRRLRGWLERQVSP